MLDDEIGRIDQVELKYLSEVARQTTNGVVITDEKGLVVWINEAFSTISGYSLDDMQGKRPGDLLQGEATDPVTVKAMSEALASHNSFDVEVLNYSKNHTPYWVRATCSPLRDDSGEINGYMAIYIDITSQKRDAELIQYTQDLLNAVIDVNTIGTWRLNMLNGELEINDQWAALLGYTLDELKPINRKTWENLTHPEDIPYCVIQLEKHAAGQIPAYNANIRMKHKKGEWIWINTRGQVSTRTDDGKAEWMLGTHLDVSTQIAAEKSLHEQSARMKAIVENMLDGVISIDAKGTIQTFNRAAEEIFGYSRDEMLGKNVNQLMASPHRENHDTYLSNYLDAGIGDVTRRIRELEALHKDGTVFPIELGLVDISNADEINFVGIVRDITLRKQRENEIHQLAFYDSLTQLPNRRLLQDRLKLVVAKCTRNKHHAALLFLDLDNFKSLNDSAGHSIGDKLLCSVAQRLVTSIRQGDSVSRLGGDEFVVVLEDLSTDKQKAANQAKAAAEKIIYHLTQSFDLDGFLYIASASIGISLFNSPHSSIEDLLKQADMAMYKAKASGRSRICFFDPQMQIAVSLRAEMEHDLHEAIKLQQFILFYQKQVVQQGLCVGFEVLLRWMHPVKGLVSPAEFIPLAEETGQILVIGEWVLHQACQTLASWSSDPVRAELTLAVNISVVQFSQKNFVKKVLSALKVSGANPTKLKLEITESLLANDVQDVTAKMLKLRAHGVSFSIDDFGTGYSSLSYLKQLPIDQLKIDQSFVRDIIDNPNDKAIAQAVITLAKSMHMNVIAEGVETEEQRAFLQILGCNEYQGYLFGKPCALVDVEI